MFILMKCQLRNDIHDENKDKDNGKSVETLVTIGVTCLLQKLAHQIV